MILPPSTRADGSQYRWDPQAGAAPVPAPAWLIALVSPRKESTGRGKAARKSPKRDLAWAMAALDDECAKIAATPPGQRNAALNLGAYNIFQIVHGNPGLLDEEMVRQRLFEAAEKCGLVADDGADSAWRTIDSGAAGAQSQPRVRPLARLEGPKPAMAAAAPAASATAAAQAPDPRRVIQLVEGNEHHAIDEAEEALIQAGGFDIYQRGGMLVRPVLEPAHAADNRSTITWRFSPVKLPFLLEMLARVAVFTVYDKRSKAWIQKKCPQFVGEMFSAREGVWRLPVALGIVHTPQFRPDGTLAMAQGYDAGTRLLFKPDGEIFPAVPDSPSKDDALAALKVLEEAIATFPFKTAVDRSVALSLLLTALCRRALDHAPLHAITAPAAGTGKSMLVDLASIMISAHDAPVMAPGKNEEEAEKRLGAALLGGDAIVAFDNCTAALSGTLLCQALTQHRVRVRILGLSQQVGVPVSALFTATGNNLTIEGDLTRRSLLCELDAGVACPELREFDFNPKTVFRQRRSELVAAGLDGPARRPGGEAQADLGAARRIRDVVILGARHPALARPRRSLPVNGPAARKRSAARGAYRGGHRLARCPRHRLQASGAADPRAGEPHPRAAKRLARGCRGTEHGQASSAPDDSGGGWEKWTEKSATACASFAPELRADTRSGVSRLRVEG